jgi:hypothetical protein
MPDISVYEEFIELSKELSLPLWLGETGENIIEWYTAMYPLAVSCGIGYNLWPWKKMVNDNSPCAIRKPENWDKIIDYAEGGPHPGYQEARKILDEYLNNISYANCVHHPEATKAVFREPSCRVRATDFEHFPGKGDSYSGLRKENHLYNYRRSSGMGIVELYNTCQRERKFAFDSMWDRFGLELTIGEYAEYAIHNVKEGATVSLDLYCDVDIEIIIKQERSTIGSLTITKKDGLYKTELVKLNPSESSRIRVEMVKGKAVLEVVCFEDSAQLI